MFLNRIAEGGDAVRYRVPENGGYKAVTFREAGEAACEICLGLMDAGLSRGDRVAILSGTRMEWCLTDIALILGGFIPVPIYPSNLPDQVEYILVHSGASVVFVEDEPQYNKVEWCGRRLPSLSFIVLMDGNVAGKDNVVMLDDLRRRGREYGAANPDAVEKRVDEIRPDDDLTIIYTSGTTGPPKGVLTRHRNYTTDVTATLQVIDIPRGSRFFQFLPLAHSFGRIEHFLTWDAMTETVFARGLQTVAEDMATVRPEIVVSVPRLYEKIYARVIARVEESGGLKKVIFYWAVKVGRDVSRHKQCGEAIPGFLALKNRIADRLVFGKVRKLMGGRLRFFVSGGAPLVREIAEFLHALGILVVEGYGLTETATIAACNPQEKCKFGTVGKALPGTEIKIASDGEILIRGDHVFKEYFDDPATTREAVDSDGWFHSGDIGVLDDDGYLRITDRKKDIIVTSGGKNIAPQNIESLFMGDPLISHVFVYGDKKKYLTALFTLSPDEILAWASRNGIRERDIQALSKLPQVEKLVRERVDAINKGLASFEQIKKFVLLGAEFSRETGELTPSLKMKRKVVIEKYGVLLDALYEKD
ncbi:MAG: long-chain fatty acid--CoA ligase [Syntrophorhabdaceae bacterium]|nr:long-chain fatty acid--CoA ligase [Syntrophorhabdaceae bacterium]